jgi:hypothetical protein
MAWSLKNKCNREFGNPNDGSRCDSAVVAFISQTSSKLGRDPPCRGAAFEPSPAFQSRESRYVVIGVAAATVDTDHRYQPSLRRLRSDMR